MSYLEGLYQTASDRDIYIINAHFSDTKKAACVCGSRNNVVLDIAAMCSAYEEAEKLGRELKHIETGNLFCAEATINFPLGRSNKRRLEEKTKAAHIQDVLPWSMLQEAVSKGCRKVWEIAEFCERTPEFVSAAIGYYKFKGFTF